MQIPFSKTMKLLAQAILDLEEEILHSLSFFSLANEEYYITKSVVAMQPGRINEQEQIGYVHQAGPKVYLALKHPDITFSLVNVFDKEGRKVNILETERFNCAYVFYLESSNPISELRLEQVQIPNPAFKTYAELLPNTKYLLNTLYWTDFAQFAKAMVSLQKLLNDSIFFTTDFLVSYLNILLGLPFITTEGYVTSIRESDENVIVIIIDKFGNLQEEKFNKMPGAVIILKVGQETKGYEPVFDIISII